MEIREKAIKKIKNIFFVILAIKIEVIKLLNKFEKLNVMQLNTFEIHCDYFF